ncbi:MAG TPA: tetratricopeptide repeat protein [Terriglobales bacterium]|nr:tetratricopeptide repeat protein [Terriglobales bacterium]
MKLREPKLFHLLRLHVLVVAIAVIALCSSHGQSATPNKSRGRASPESFENLALRARQAMNAGRLTEATQLYVRTSRLNPNWAEGWWHLGTLLFDAGHFRDAREAFLHFVAVEKKQPGPGYGMLGLSEFQLKHYSEALAALERGRKFGLGTNPEFTHTVLYHDGILETLAGQPEIALERLTLVANQIAAAHPDAPKDAVFADVELLDALGMAALRRAKLPSDIPAMQAPVVREAGRAQALIALQDRVAAEEELKQMLVLYPSEPGVNYMYGVFLLKEHPPLAVDEFRREIEVSPGNAAAHIQLALEFLRTAEYEEGLKYAKEAIALAPNDFVAHVACGRLLLALGNTNRAIEELRTGVKLAPGSPDAHFALSRALSQVGRNAEAARERAEFERLEKLAEAADR